MSFRLAGAAHYRQEPQKSGFKKLWFTFNGQTDLTIGFVGHVFSVTGITSTINSYAGERLFGR
jgi:hypothetical protein